MENINKNAPENSIIFKSLHGSHLYGLNHAGSDIDWYAVHNANVSYEGKAQTPKTDSFQTVVDGIDMTLMTWKTFHIQAFEGVPQALEAMFSERVEIDKIEAWRHGFHVGLPNMMNKYAHAIEKFATFEFKRRRHAMRYVVNLNEALKAGGRFNPTLSDSEKLFISEAAMDKNYIQILRKYSPVELNLDVDKIANSIKNDNA